MSDSDLGSHELLQGLDVVPGPTPPTVADNPATEPAQVPERDESGRFASKESEAPEALDAEADDAEAPAEDGDIEQDDDDSEAPRRKNGSWAKRVSKLTAQKYQLESQLAAAVRERRELVAILQKEIDPSLEFENPAQFTQAIIERSLAQHQLRQADQKIADTQEEDLNTSRQAFVEAVEEARSQHPDIYDVLASKDLPIPRQAVSLFSNSDLGPQIAYHIGKNQAVKEMFTEFTDQNGNLTDPIGYAREFGKLEERLSRPIPKKVTKAPPPARPLATTGSAGTFDAATASVGDISRQIYGR